MEYRTWIAAGGLVALLAGGLMFLGTTMADSAGGASGWASGMMGPGLGRGPRGYGGMMGQGGMMGGWTGGKEQLPDAPARPDAERAQLAVSIQEWKMSPAALTVESGKRLVLTVRNDGTMPHNFAIPGLGVRLVGLAPGDTRQIEVNADQPGTYQYLCDIGGHAQAGQRGTLTIR